MHTAASAQRTDALQRANACALLGQPIQQVALPERCVAMNVVPPGDISPRTALQMLPPLLKGYLRLGGFVGEGAVIDHDFGSTDVCVVVKTQSVTDRYLRHYTRDDVAKNEDAT